MVVKSNEYRKYDDGLNRSFKNKLTAVSYKTVFVNRLENYNPFLFI